MVERSLGKRWGAAVSLGKTRKQAGSVHRTERWHATEPCKTGRRNHPTTTISARRATSLLTGCRTKPGFAEPSLLALNHAHDHYLLSFPKCTVSGSFGRRRETSLCLPAFLDPTDMRCVSPAVGHISLEGAHSDCGSFAGPSRGPNRDKFSSILLARTSPHRGRYRRFPPGLRFALPWQS